MEALVVDGYNVVHAWDSLRLARQHSLELAREALVARLAVYQQVHGSSVTVVFDAHFTAARRSTTQHQDGVDVVFTRKGVTADHEIERLAYTAAQEGRMLLVASSDRFHRDMLRGMGAAVIDARELELRVEAAEQDLQQRLRRDYGR